MTTMMREYLAPAKVGIWQIMFENDSLGFDKSCVGKDAREAIPWFLKHKFLKKVKKTYFPNKKNVIVNSMMCTMKTIMAQETKETIAKEEADARVTK